MEHRLWSQVRPGLLLFIFSAVVLGQQSGIHFNSNNGEYTNFLVAIHESTPEDASLIEKIKEGFIAASEMLTFATKNQTKMGEVKILIPSAWNMTADNDAFLETYLSADMRVESGINGGIPGVFGIPECGKRGDYMVFTPNYVKKKQTPKFARALLHELAHLLFGVFDEYPVDGYPKFYIDSTGASPSIEVVRCNRAINYNTFIADGGVKHYGRCGVNDTTMLYDDECKVERVKYQDGIQASLMDNSLLAISSIVKFCEHPDRVNDASEAHNYEANNKHNNLCNQLSVWEVLRDHPDFATPVQSLSTEAIRFTTLKQQGQNFDMVVVMDVSGSMSSNDKITQQHQAVVNLINDQLNDQTKLGLVAFSSNATKLTSTLLPLSSLSNRQNLTNLVPSTTGGFTAIGQGVIAAKELLTRYGTRNARRSRIILLSDGLENVLPYVNTTIGNITAEGIVIYTILFGNGADNILIDVAKRTGGKSFYASGYSGSLTLTDTFSEIVSDIYAKEGADSRQKITSAFFTTSTTSSCHDAVIDTALSADVLFTFNWLSSTVAPSIYQTSPSQATSTYSPTSTNSYTIKCPTPCQAGRWRVCMVASSSFTVEMTVFGSQFNANQSSLPITVQTKIDNIAPDFLNADQVKVHAIVKRGEYAVIGATVEATVSIENVGDHVYPMLDTGTGADAIKHDGIYSLFILKSSNTGKHTISVKVTGDSSSTMIKNSLLEFLIDGDTNSTIEEPQPIEEEFERQAVAGFFDAQTATDPNTDKIPPAKISDVTLTNTSQDGNFVDVEWTAVGDDFDEGNATSYELYTADNITELISDNGRLVEQKELVKGTLSSPKSAGETERYKIKLGNKTTAAFAVRAVDKSGQKGARSNLITVTTLTLSVTPPNTTTTSTTSSTTTTTPLPTSTSLSTTFSTTTATPLPTTTSTNTTSSTTTTTPLPTTTSTSTTSSTTTTTPLPTTTSTSTTSSTTTTTPLPTTTSTSTTSSGPTTTPLPTTTSTSTTSSTITTTPLPTTTSTSTTSSTTTTTPLPTTTSTSTTSSTTTTTSTSTTSSTTTTTLPPTTTSTTTISSTTTTLLPTNSSGTTSTTNKTAIDTTPSLLSNVTKQVAPWIIVAAVLGGTVLGIIVLLVVIFLIKKWYLEHKGKVSHGDSDPELFRVDEMMPSKPPVHHKFSENKFSLPPRYPLT